MCYFNTCTGALGHPVTASWLVSFYADALGCPVTSSQLTSLCVGALEHPVTSSQLTFSDTVLQQFARGVLDHGIIWVIYRGWSRSTSLQETRMVASCFRLIGVGQQGLCHSGSVGLQWVASALVESMLQVVVCMEYAAGVGVAGATAGGLTAWVAGAGADVVGATSPMADVSGLTASGRCSLRSLWAHWYCPPPMTWTGMGHGWLLR